VTYAKAGAKAKKLTAETGREHKPQRDARSPGGWSVYDVEKKRARNRVADARRHGSAERRANWFRARTKRNIGVRLNVTAADIAALRASQGEKCPITGKPLDVIPTANDHAHGDEHNGASALRGVIHRNWNSVLGRTDQELFDYADNLMAYAGKRRVVLIIRMCARPPRKRKVSKKALARVRVVLRRGAA
jgi:hypothetical protein